MYQFSETVESYLQLKCNEVTDLETRNSFLIIWCAQTPLTNALRIDKQAA